ncbi:uncharacterized protein LOC124927226 [Impatiens glandulifera]|uniref:uncharacterized protein LOC124927226 n=1 Tax=Impatiens glandulifera TaxID=253017 RepID=UPI001FB19D31|nr:uncharacterized protein LOC124927226 [Impatiens glandulifera]
MSSIFSSCRVFAPPWWMIQKKTKNVEYSDLLNSKKKFHFPFTLSSSSSPLSDDSTSPLIKRQVKIGYDPSEDLFGLDVDLNPLRRPVSGALEGRKLRSWFGPNGQYIKELPCPSCRGRGYTPCADCGIERSRQDCSQCYGKGIMSCSQCLGDCVIWEEAIDEQPWEEARSISPFKVKEDDEVDNLDIKVDVKRRTKRVYQSPSPEVGLKISRSLKSLNAKTGLFSKRMKIIHRDPLLHAQRVAAIKKTKGMPTARKQASESMKAFFKNPENRRMRSISMKGVKFYCKNCGLEGHRRHYCPALKEDRSVDRRYECRLCGEKGHNMRTCRKHNSTESVENVSRHYQCKVCGKHGHNRRTCPQASDMKPDITNDKNDGSVSSDSSCSHLNSH